MLRLYISITQLYIRGLSMQGFWYLERILESISNDTKEHVYMCFYIKFVRHGEKEERVNKIFHP